MHSDKSPRCRAMAMVMVMIALAAATIMTLSFLAGQTTSVALAHNSSRQVQARAIAEDAVELIRGYLRDTDTWRTDFIHGTWTDPQRLNGGSFRVMFEDADDADLADDASTTVKLTVEASYDGVGHRLSVDLQPVAYRAPLAVLLIVSNTTLGEQDSVRKSLLESWGCRVVIIDDGASDADLQAAASSADVAYVSRHANHNEIDTRLNGLKLGVVTDGKRMQSKLGVSDTGDQFVSDSIKILDNTHPITEGLPTGEIAILTEPLLLVHSRSIAAGATRLANRPNDWQNKSPVLSYLDIGDADLEGNPSPHRRVILPWGESSFRMTKLADHGKTILRQSIEWAAAGENGGGLLHHWPLNETSGVTVQDVYLGEDGNYVMGPGLGGPGILDRSVQLDRSADRITLPASAFDQRGDLTFSVWVKSTRRSGQCILSGNRADMDDAIKLYLRTPTSLRFYHENASTTWTVPDLADGRWHLVTVTRDQTESESTIYIDGQSMGTRTMSLSDIRVEHVVIGEEQDSVDGSYDSNIAWDGLIDDVRIYESVLTAAEVRALYEAATVFTEEPRLIALYEFNEPASETPVLVSHWPLDEPSARPGFQEVSGVVAFEAEHFTQSHPGTGNAASSEWNVISDSDAGGTQALAAQPNNGINTGLNTHGPRAGLRNRLRDARDLPRLGTHACRRWHRRFGPCRSRRHGGE